MIHAIAMVSMLAFLIRTLPGGSTAVDADRVALIVAHPIAFRLSWIPWQACAVIDLLQGIAMFRARWLPRAWTAFIVVITVVAVIPDQIAQATWITYGVSLAQRDAAQYLVDEKWIYTLTAGAGAFFYTVAAVAWSVAFAKAKTWSRALTVLSVLAWVAMFAASTSPLLASVADVHVSLQLVALCNAIGFTFLELWLVLVCEFVLARRRPLEAWGRRARWKYPSTSAVGRALDLVANSRLIEELGSLLPVLAMRSEIEDVVYVSYLVDAARLEKLVPEGLALQRLGAQGEHALFTFLTYRHGHFGPALLGPLRNVACGSPIQSNWRIHVVDPRTQQRGITFITNAVDNVVYAIGARVFASGMPMHAFARASIDVDGARTRVTLENSNGSAPDAIVDVRRAGEPKLEGAWAECFGDWRGFLAYCVPQDRALSSDVARGVVVRQEIHLGIPLDACAFVDGTVTSKLAASIAGDAKPLCFSVERVAFSFSEQALDRL